MLRTLLRSVLVLIIVAAIVAFFVGYRMADRDETSEPVSAVGTSGGAVDIGSAREAGANIAERVAEGANQAQRIASNAALTAKIKSKMALDDTIEAARIDIDTAEDVVTLRGTVESPAQRERAVQLARETDGVASVVDRLTIR
jgi:hyperosmotically inducible protein